MIKHSFLLLLIASIHFSGCVYTSDHFEGYSTTIILDTTYEVEVIAGTSTPIDTAEISGTRSLSFDSVRGGRTILFGLWVISEGNGHTADRLVIYQNGDRIAGFSINELKAMGPQPIGLDKYLE